MRGSERLGPGGVSPSRCDPCFHPGGLGRATKRLAWASTRDFALQLSGDRVQSALWHQINPILGRGESVIRAAQRLLGTWWPRVAPVRAVLAAGGSTVVFTCESLGVLASSSPRKKMLTFVTAAIVGLAVIILLLELSLRRELAKEASATSTAALADLQVQTGPSAVESTAPTANPSEREPLVQGALESAPSNDFQPLAPPWAESVPLPRPRPKTP
jgi:hypothetical protein